MERYTKVITKPLHFIEDPYAFMSYTTLRFVDYSQISTYKLYTVGHKILVNLRSGYVFPNNTLLKLGGLYESFKEND